MRKRAANNRYVMVVILAALLVAMYVNLSCARTVTDETGRLVTVRPEPQRIVSLAPGITETLYALGLDDKIVGVTTFCNWPVQARTKTRIGGFTNPSLEKIVSLKPDLILATADGNRKETVQQLERIGLPVYVTNPTDTQGVLRSIVHIGAITHREREAENMVASIQKRLDHIALQIRHKRKPRVFFQLGLEPLITAGRGTLTNEVIERAGGVNVAGLDAASYPHYSAEGIIGASPDIIIFAPMVNDERFAAVKRYWQKFGDVPAVKNNKIYPVSADLINRASPRLFDAIEIMALIFHPEIRNLDDRKGNR